MAHLCSSPSWPEDFGCWQGKVRNVSPCVRVMMGITLLLLLGLVQSECRQLAGHLPFCCLTGLQLIPPHRNCQSRRSPLAIQRRRLGPTAWCTKCCTGLCGKLALTLGAIWEWRCSSTFSKERTVPNLPLPQHCCCDRSSLSLSLCALVFFLPDNRTCLLRDTYPSHSSLFAAEGRQIELGRKGKPHTQQARL